MISRNRERRFANSKILQSYVRWNVLELTALKAPGIVDFCLRDLRFRLCPVMTPNCKIVCTQRVFEARISYDTMSERPHVDMWANVKYLSDFVISESIHHTHTHTNNRYSFTYLANSV